MTIEQANEYFSSLPEGFAPAEELRAALTADVQKVQFVGVAGTAGKTAAAGLLAAILREAAFHVGFYRAGCEPLSARIAIGGVSVDPVLLCQAAEALNAAKALPREAAELAAAARCFGAAGCGGAAGCRSGIGPAPDAGLRRHGHRSGRREPLSGASGRIGRRRHAEGRRLRHCAGAAEGCSE